MFDRSVIIPATQIRVCAVDVFSFISVLACGFECALLSLLLDSPWTWLAVWESDVWTEQLNTERVNSVGELSFKCVWILILDNTPIIQTLVSFSIWNVIGMFLFPVIYVSGTVWQLPYSLWIRELFLFLTPLDQMWIENVTALRMKLGFPKDVPAEKAS